MTVEVRLPTLLRGAAGGQAVVKLDGSTVGEVLHALVEANPALSGQVLDADGTLHRFVNVYLNDDDVRYLQRLDTSVADGDVVSILPAVAGGCGPSGRVAGCCGPSGSVARPSRRAGVEGRALRR